MEVAITGIGLVSSLGDNPGDILSRIGRGETAIRPLPDPGGVSPCPGYAPILDFDAADFFPENKTLRMMSRDAQLAVVAARRAMENAKISQGELYRPEEIALYGATGLSGIAPREISRLVRGAAADDGSLDLERFGTVALRRTRPVLSFKILSNMPICYVSIFENIRGPNAIFTPWEGNAAQAIAAGIRAVRSGNVPCALVGGCDVKTHTLSIAGLDRLGVFESWLQSGEGTIPGEGAAFLVLENLDHAAARGAKIYARIRSVASRSIDDDESPEDAIAEIFDEITNRPACESIAPNLIVASADGEPRIARAETNAMKQSAFEQTGKIYPKLFLGNTFAAAAPINVALAAKSLHGRIERGSAIASCFGPGGELSAFLLESP